jgi:hypothetical protein
MLYKKYIYADEATKLVQQSQYWSNAVIQYSKLQDFTYEVSQYSKMYWLKGLQGAAQASVV